jgi:CO dehydrogenase/acetyl-CoA synthase epsilon subunit
MDLEFGDVLIFSGNHIHGSLLSNTKRLNLETRTISEQDEYKFKIPKNIDSFTKVKKKAWFSCLKKEI